MNYILTFCLLMLISCNSTGQNTVEQVVSPVSQSSDLFSKIDIYDKLADSLLHIRGDSLLRKSDFTPSNPWAGKLDTIFYYDKTRLLYVTQGSPYQDSVKFRGFYIKGQLFKMQIFKLRKGNWQEDAKEYFNNANWIGLGPRVEGLPDVHTTMKGYNRMFNELLKKQK
jgi:hypothetical protein